MENFIFLCSATNHNFLLIHSKYGKLRNGETWYSSFSQFYIVWKKNYYSTFLNLFQRIQRLERCSKALHHFCAVRFAVLTMSKILFTG